jgi:hypothetical protein
VIIFLLLTVLNTAKKCAVLIELHLIVLFSKHRESLKVEETVRNQPVFSEN